MQYIVSSVKTNNFSSLEIGNKSKVLMELKSLGFNVPDFFVISSNIDDVFTFQNEIFDQYEKLGSDLVSVRSSATGEDGQVKSFAGQYKTVLNVSKNNLCKSIKECIDSLNTEHALFYSQNNDGQRMAVIVQKMITAEVSGVAFSADPVRNDTSIIIIESVNGPCDLLVSGKVNPEHYSIDKKTLDSAKIPDIIKRVGIITKEIEDELGYYVDVEWAFSNKELYILQARPITTLK